MSTPAARPAPGPDPLENPGYLKLDLMLRGVRVSPGAVESTERLARLSCDFAALADLDLVLPGETWVSVPFRDPFAARSPYKLLRGPGGFELARGEARLPVEVVPPPAFYEKRTASGVPLAEIGVLRGGFLALAPFKTCHLIEVGRACAFCSAVPPEGLRAEARAPRTVDDVVEAVRAAVEERPVEIVYLSFGMTEADDRGIALLEPYIRAIKRSFDVLVGVDIVPPRTDAWIDRTYAMGVDTLAYNLEVFGPEHFERLCPGLAREVGRERYLEALTYATTVFPRGAVTSNLIVGLEPPLSTMLGIDRLAEIGVVPVLPLYRPFKGIDLRSGEVPPVEDLAAIYGHLYETLKRRKLPGKWVRNVSVGTTPLEARFFVGEEARLQVMLRGFFGTRFGSRLGARLSDLRRSLRVKEVRESLDSSGL
jgi:hypothetical protein